MRLKESHISFLPIIMTSLVESDLPDDSETTPVQNDLAVSSENFEFVAARKILREVGCDPRVPNLFGGINMAAINEADMADIRNLICAVLSVRDKRPWSNNGTRVLVDGMKVYMGKISNS